MSLLSYHSDNILSNCYYLIAIMNKLFYQDIGEKISNIRKEKGYSQNLLANKIGKKSASYINLIENGRRRVSLQGLVKIAAALNVTLNTFLEESYEAMDTNSLLNLALISDPELNPEQRALIIEFIDFLRSKKS